MKRFKKFLCGFLAWTGFIGMFIAVSSADTAAELTGWHYVAAIISLSMFTYFGLTYAFRWGVNGK